jgi:inositol-phosphate phosphatase/L-galactose 1-phosphate phosphatase/histidinol-phosphatase
MADASGPVIAGHFRSNISVDRKSDKTVVTQADRDAEAAIRSIIADRYPDHGIVGEEFGADGADREFVWILDPVDGTQAFISGLPTFGTLIALCRYGEPILGVIDQPVTGERWLAARGIPARARDMRGVWSDIATRACPALDQAILYSTSPFMFEGPGLDAFADVSAGASVTRYGTDCYAYAMVASGHGDLVIEANMNIYDYLALVPVVQSAGGVMSDWHGLPLTMASGNQVVAAGDARVHEEVLKLLSGAAVH